MTLIDEYLKKIDGKLQVNIPELRKIINEVVPEATEAISYGMPAYKLNGKTFFGFAVYKHHIGIYPYSGEVIEKFKDEIESLNLKYSKGAIQLPLNGKFPTKMIKKILEHRLSSL